MRKIKKKREKLKIKRKKLNKPNPIFQIYKETWPDIMWFLMNFIKDEKPIFIAKISSKNQRDNFTKILWGKLSKESPGFQGNYIFLFNPLYQSEAYLNFNKGNMPLANESGIDDFSAQQWLNREFDPDLENFTYKLAFNIQEIQFIDTDNAVLIFDEKLMDWLLKTKLKEI